MLQKPGVYNSQLKKLDFALPVGVRLTVENIESVSSEEMDLTLTFIMTQTWVDKRLAHGGENKTGAFLPACHACYACHRI